MLQYMSKYIYFSDFSYGGNEGFRDNAALSRMASSSSKKLDF